MINLQDIQPSIRRLKEMVEVVFDQEWLKKTDLETEVYYMWRGVAESDQEKEKISQAGLRYDILEFAPLTLGQEFNKTLGHIHSLVPETDLTYPEIYGVLKGEVYFLLQKFSEDKIEDIFTVHCLAGHKYIIPPGYAHMTINPTAQKTVLANWLATASSQSYDEIKKMKGAGYYAVIEGTVPSSAFLSEDALEGTVPEKTPQWVKNPTYSSVPSLRFVEPNNLSQFGISKDQLLYSLVNDLAKLDFLKAPQNYSWE